MAGLGISAEIPFFDGPFFEEPAPLVEGYVLPTSAWPADPRETRTFAALVGGVPRDPPGHRPDDRSAGARPVLRHVGTFERLDRDGNYSQRSYVPTPLRPVRPRPPDRGDLPASAYPLEQFHADPSGLGRVHAPSLLPEYGDAGDIPVRAMPPRSAALPGADWQQIHWEAGTTSVFPGSLQNRFGLGGLRLVTEAFGSGGRAKVHLLESMTGHRLAGKEITASDLNSDELANEMSIMTMLGGHPHLCEGFGIARFDIAGRSRRLGLMEYLDGKGGEVWDSAFQEAVRPGGGFIPERHAWQVPMRLARDLVSGIAHMERTYPPYETGSDRPGIVHGDLKTDNFIVTRAGDAKIFDFGGCVPAGRTAINFTDLFAAPELRSAAACDSRTDMYSIAIIVEMTIEGAAGFDPTRDTGRPPRVGSIFGSDRRKAGEYVDFVTRAKSRLADRMTPEQALRHPFLNAGLDTDIARGYMARIAAGS